jgi:Holliday junction DNA helicase RuvA
VHFFVIVDIQRKFCKKPAHFYVFNVFGDKITIARFNFADMYEYFKGEITCLEPGYAVVECHGIGFGMKISPSTYERLKGKKEGKLYARLIVRQDAHLLYGFAGESDRVAFDKLVSISGVGPNIALTILSVLSPADLYAAVESEDVAVLRRIKGVGPKTAGRIVLELKGQLPQSAVAQTPTHLIVRNEALAALAVLGFPKGTMEKRVDEIIAAGALSVEEVVRLALRNP